MKRLISLLSNLLSFSELIFFLLPPRLAFLFPHFPHKLRILAIFIHEICHIGSYIVRITLRTLLGVCLRSHVLCFKAPLFVPTSELLCSEHLVYKLVAIFFSFPIVHRLIFFFLLCMALASWTILSSVIVRMVGACGSLVCARTWGVVKLCAAASSVRCCTNRYIILFAEKWLRKDIEGFIVLLEYSLLTSGGIWMCFLGQRIECLLDLQLVRRSSHS